MSLKYIGLGILLKIGVSLAKLFRIVPKKNTKWAFVGGSWRRMGFRDNAKYFFLYLINNKKEVSPIWITANKKEYNLLKKFNLPTHYLFSLKGIYNLITAKLIIHDYVFPEISPLYKVGIDVNLWHGAGIKKIEWDAKKVKQGVIRKITPEIYTPNYLLAPSKRFQEIYTSAFRLQKKRIFICGNTPKAYALTHPYKHDEINACNTDGENLIVYLPTFRKEGLDYLNEIKMNKEWISKELERINGKLVIKLHPIQKSKFKLNTDRIITLNSDCDLYPLLRKAKMLISDFSSVIFEFTQTKKPIIVYTPDIKKYFDNERELYFGINRFGFANAKGINELIRLIKENWNKTKEYLTVIPIFYENKGDPCECLYYNLKKLIITN